MSKRVKLDSSVPPSFDYLFEVDEDIECENDSLSRFMENAKAAGAFKKMTPDAAHQHVEALREESAERTARFEKRFDAGGEVGERIEKIGKFEMKYVNGKLASAREVEE
jgi:hypothetical protein